MRKALILLTILAVEIGLFTAIEQPDFARFGGVGGYFASYFRDVFVQSAPIFLAAFGMTWVLASGGIDLSVGSAIALIACVMGSFDGSASFWWTAVPLGLLAGLALGCFNGVLIAWLDIPPIIATLGTMILFRGACFVVVGDVERAPFGDVPGYPLLGELVFVVPTITLLFLGLGALITRSRWRRQVLMFGGNRVAARYAGVRISRRTVEIYGLLGLLAFVAAVVYTARNGSVKGSSLTGFELQVIVAVVLGGTRVEGGVASLAGSFFGVLVIAVLEEGLRGATLWGEEHLPFKISHLRYILLGGLLVLGVWLNTHVASRGRSARES